MQQSQNHSKKEHNVTTILLHSISWWLRDKEDQAAPDELDDCSVEHIEKSIKEGFHQGELCVIGDDGETEFRGWWSIETTC